MTVSGEPPTDDVGREVGFVVEDDAGLGKPLPPLRFGITGFGNIYRAPPPSPILPPPVSL